MGPPGAGRRSPSRTSQHRRQKARRYTRGGSARISFWRRGCDVGRDRKRLWQRDALLILVDSNIPMYLIGAPHPHKADAQRLLEKLVSDREPLVTDAEVLQEILHRYIAIARRDAIQPAFDALLGIVDQVLPVDRAVAE